ncbi:MAG: DUF4199 domain-containing protein [Bacteroidales bacterium]|nr:DUF4199 domain-containing protein [Bacteroidales bacterium]
MENSQKNLIIQSVKIGALFGLLGIAISLIIYLLNINMLSIGFGIVFIIINIGLSIVIFAYGMRYIRDKYFNGTISYLNKSIIGLIIGLVSGWLAGLFGILLFTYYDPGFMEGQIDRFIIMLEEMGLDEAGVMKQEQRIRESFTLTGQLKAMFIRTPIFAFILSLIIAAFVKKQKTDNESTVL